MSRLINGVALVLAVFLGACNGAFDTTTSPASGD